MRRIWISALVAVLTGCGSAPVMQAMQPEEAVAPEPEITQPTGYCGEPIPAELGVRLSLVRQQQAQGQLLSALASLDALPDDTPTYRLLRADILRQMGRFDQARPLYERLRSSCLAGQALHGLGRIEAQQRRPDRALQHLRAALGRIPTDADLRNDLGFLLLAMGRDEAARHELLTALELDNRHREAARNLWFLLLKNREHEAARSLSRRFGWPDADRDLYLAAIARFTPLTPGDVDE